ncbi:hypothetical protein MMC07_002754 [Pseudocyphellaria aurata]|nr:hypothetical protein [Pseudocyphellaria aurata]
MDFSTQKSEEHFKKYLMVRMEYPANGTQESEYPFKKYITVRVEYGQMAYLELYEAIWMNEGRNDPLIILDQGDANTGPLEPETWEQSSEHDADDELSDKEYSEGYREDYPETEGINVEPHHVARIRNMEGDQLSMHPSSGFPRDRAEIDEYADMVEAYHPSDRASVVENKSFSIPIASPSRPAWKELWDDDASLSSSEMILFQGRKRVKVVERKPSQAPADSPKSGFQTGLSDDPVILSSPEESAESEESLGRTRILNWLRDVESLFCATEPTDGKPRQLNRPEFTEFKKFDISKFKRRRRWVDDYLRGRIKDWYRRPKS